MLSVKTKNNETVFIYYTFGSSINSLSLDSTAAWKYGLLLCERHKKKQQFVAFLCIMGQKGTKNILSEMNSVSRREGNVHFAKE